MERVQIYSDVENRQPRNVKNLVSKSNIHTQENSKRQALGNISNAANLGTRKQPFRSAKQANSVLSDIGNLENFGNRQKQDKNVLVYEDEENQIATRSAAQPQIPKNSRLNTYIADVYKPQVQTFPILRENQENEDKESRNRLEGDGSPMVLDSSECSEADVSMQISKPVVDHLTEPEYEHDTYLYLKELEQRHRPRVGYMKKQPDITSSMRIILVDWLVEVTEEYNLHLETLFLAVSYIDRFLSTMSVLRAKLQLVGTASMFIASKYEEIYPPDLGEFVYITDDTYTKKQVLRMEHLILRVLSFDLASPTIVEFINRFSRHCGASTKVTHLATYLAELSLLDIDTYAKYLNSQIAASCVALANHILGRDPWPEYIQGFFEISTSDLTECVFSLMKTHAAAPRQLQQASRDKYKDEQRFQGVSLLDPAERMPW